MLSTASTKTGVPMPDESHLFNASSGESGPNLNPPRNSITLRVVGVASACCLSDMAGCGEWANGASRTCPECGSTWSRRNWEIHRFNPEVDPFLVVDHHRKDFAGIAPEPTEYLYATNFDEWVRRLEALADDAGFDPGFPAVSCVEEARKVLSGMGWICAVLGTVRDRSRPYEIWASFKGSGDQLVLSWKSGRIGIRRIPLEMAF